MKIKTKYDIGYEFYVPRVLTRHEKHVIQHVDDDGCTYTYYRDIKILEAIARRKVVKRIEIHVKDTVECEYWCTNDGNESFGSKYTEEEMTITDPDTALLFAKKWRDEQQCEYFGSNTH